MPKMRKYLWGVQICIKNMEKKFTPLPTLTRPGSSCVTRHSSLEGDGPDSAWRSRAPGPHRNTARQAMDGLWTEARGQQKQSNDPGNNQHILNTPTTGRR